MRGQVRTVPATALNPNSVESSVHGRCAGGASQVWEAGAAGFEHPRMKSYPGSRDQRGGEYLLKRPDARSSGAGWVVRVAVERVAGPESSGRNMSLR